jgi:small subunit ribosomal protein S8
MSDPIADMLTRIRNGQSARKQRVEIPASSIKIALSKVLHEEGYIGEYSVSEGSKPLLSVTLKYYQGKPAIEGLERISRPGLRIYKSKDTLPKMLGGLGISIISTSKGLMTDRMAHANSQGGEILCTVY